MPPEATAYTDASGFTGTPDRILSPQSEQDLLDLLADTVRTCTPLTVAGNATGLTGSGVPQGGTLLSLTHFRKLEIRPGHALAGAAISLLDLRDAAAPTGQFYAPDPTEIAASLGGSIATNASGSRSFRFGATRRHLRALRVATMDGQIRTFRRGDPMAFPVPTLPLPGSTKNTAGFRLQPGMDWLDLFCGSEGTLGIVLEAEVALLPTPPDLLSGVIFFPSDDAALAAVDAWRPIPQLRMLEYADRASLDLILSRYPQIPPQAQAALLIETDAADPATLETWLAHLTAANALLDASWIGLSARDRERFRAFRHALPEAVVETMRSRGFLNMGTDYAVPIARNADMLAFYRETLARELPNRSVIYGHIGDAHLHVNMLPATPDEAATAQRLLTVFAQKAVALGGTVSAEHGLGKRKRQLLELQFTPEEIAAMRAVKHHLDPHWLLGRGTLFTPPE
jgi:FAD/FMN-containing dehydrogenase